MTDLLKPDTIRIPTAEELAALSNDQKTRFTAVLETTFRDLGKALITLREQSQAAETAEAEARTEWETTHQALIDKAKWLAGEVKVAEDHLRAAAVAYHRLTGKNRFQEAFEVYTQSVAVYDDQAMLTWLITEAPSALAKRLLILKKAEVNKWVLSKATQSGAIPEVEEISPVPAMVRCEKQGRILSKGLSALQPPQPDLLSVLAASTSEYVKEVLKPDPLAALKAATASLDLSMETADWWIIRRETDAVVQLPADSAEMIRREGTPVLGPYETEETAQKEVVPF